MNSKTNDIFQEQRQKAVAICNSSKRGVKIACIPFIIMAIIFLIVEFNPGTLVAAGMIVIILLIVALPANAKYNKSIQIITNEEPEICIVTRIGYMRSGKMSIPAAYFIYKGTEGSAPVYNTGIQENDTVYVWKNRKVYIMVK